MTTTAKRWIPAILYFLLILGLSSIPARNLQGTQWFYGVDKVAHILLYAGAAWWVRRATASSWTAILIVIAFGALDETYQRLTPGRECSVADWCADGLGALLGCLCYHFYANFRRCPTAS
jgi:VanZ family protein